MLDGPQHKAACFKDMSDGRFIMSCLHPSPPRSLDWVFDPSVLKHLVQPSVVAVMLLITGVILWLGRGRNSVRGIQDMSIRDALVIGIVQGVAVLPGISRSGSTIASGVLLGLDRELSARFSLLISMPAIVGATILEIGKGMDQMHEPIGVYVVGMVVAALVGYGSISLIIKLVRQDHFHLFSYYLWPLGISILLWDTLK